MAVQIQNGPLSATDKGQIRKAADESVKSSPEDRTQSKIAHENSGFAAVILSPATNGNDSAITPPRPDAPAPGRMVPPQPTTLNDGP